MVDPDGRRDGRPDKLLRTVHSGGHVVFGDGDASVYLHQPCHDKLPVDSVVVELCVVHGSGGGWVGLDVVESRVACVVGVFVC